MARFVNFGAIAGLSAGAIARKDDRHAEGVLLSLTGQGRDLSDTAFWDSKSRQTVFGISVVACLLAGVFGLFLSWNHEFTRAVVRAIAWEERLPRAAAYINAQYQADRTLKDQQIWRLKEP